VGRHGVKALQLLCILLLRGPEAILMETLREFPLLLQLARVKARPEHPLRPPETSPLSSRGSGTSAELEAEHYLTELISLLLDHKRLALRRHCAQLAITQHGQTPCYPHLTRRLVREDLLVAIGSNSAVLPVFALLHAEFRPPVMDDTESYMNDPARDDGSSHSSHSLKSDISLPVAVSVDLLSSDSLTIPFPSCTENQSSESHLSAGYDPWALPYPTSTPVTVTAADSDIKTLSACSSELSLTDAWNSNAGNDQPSSDPFSSPSDPFATNSDPFATGHNPYAGTSDPFAASSDPFSPHVSSTLFDMPNPESTQPTIAIDVVSDSTFPTTPSNLMKTVPHTVASSTDPFDPFSFTSPIGSNSFDPFLPHPNSAGRSDPFSTAEVISHAADPFSPSLTSLPSHTTAVQSLHHTDPFTPSSVNSLPTTPCLTDTMFDPFSSQSNVLLTPTPSQIHTPTQSVVSDPFASNLSELNSSPAIGQSTQTHSMLSSPLTEYGRMQSRTPPRYGPPSSSPFGTAGLGYKPMPYSRVGGVAGMPAIVREVKPIDPFEELVKKK